MSNKAVTESKWEQRWHDGIIDSLDLLLKGFGKHLSVQCNRGASHGPDIVVRTRGNAPKLINIEVQMHPSGKGFPQTMQRWADRHVGAQATFVVCPTALLATLANRIENHPSLGKADHVYVFGDGADNLILLCGCVFALTCTSS